MISNVIFLAAFTLVTGGEIQSVKSVGTGSTLRVSAEAVVHMASASGMAVRADGEAGVISVSHGPPTSPRLSGFSGSQVVFVIDGTIVSSPSRAVNGVPYVPPTSLQRVAEKMGFQASLDTKAKVLALSGGSASGQTDGPQAETQRFDDVCAYMDALKKVWDSTEPSISEKATFRRLANDFQAMNTGAMKRDRSQVDVLVQTLESFGKKVDQRESQTASLTPPPAGAEVQRIGLEFLGRVQDVLRDSKWLTDEMNPDSDATKEEVEAVIAKLEQADRDVQKIGARFNREVVRVRGSNGCGPP